MRVREEGYSNFARRPCEPAGRIASRPGCRAGGGRAAGRRPRRSRRGWPRGRTRRGPGWSASSDHARPARAVGDLLRAREMGLVHHLALPGEGPGAFLRVLLEGRDESQRVLPVRLGRRELLVDDLDLAWA